MDPVLLICIALVGVIVAGIFITLFMIKKSQQKKSEGGEDRQQGQAARRGVVRGVRQRHVPRLAAVHEQAAPDDRRADDSDNNEDHAEADLSKLGAKKRAKLEAKAERKAQREIEERQREERKKREEQQQKIRDEEIARQNEEERKREEAEKAAIEEKERREHEEYLKMKEAFQVEEEGYEENDDEKETNLLKDFVDHIKRNKIVILEDLAQQFSLKTTKVIDRIKQMQADGILSGVIDDRGKFIYISQEELEAVAKFVKQRGRVSIQELAEHSNTLINLNSANVVEG
ncbi:hypothetical protein TKK_0018681 [Trichogramma kaykai]|uniref:DDRGK domain-containing protein 1 n=1 Tax=Trichogramma kaykai TaxID=54128 RepID=A0ABD2VXR3_9HYME